MIDGYWDDFFFFLYVHAEKQQHQQNRNQIKNAHWLIIDTFITFTEVIIVWNTCVRREREWEKQQQQKKFFFEKRYVFEMMWLKTNWLKSPMIFDNQSIIMRFLSVFYFDLIWSK